jgi:hypothetical protein
VILFTHFLFLIFCLCAFIFGEPCNEHIEVQELLFFRFSIYVLLHITLSRTYPNIYIGNVYICFYGLYVTVASGGI